ncbi:MAG: hypothetical protein CEE40_12640 [Chloroflexi bacterium B3_Chlor]|nr:MAG: hypothetical protein CEE40_12640 [Chloroflexi bacterium B3_Chlor]
MHCGPGLGVAVSAGAGEGDSSTTAVWIPPTGGSTLRTHCDAQEVATISTSIKIGTRSARFTAPLRSRPQHTRKSTLQSNLLGADYMMTQVVNVSPL